MKRRNAKSATPLVPEQIGRYEVLLPIASGGMGTVYLARNRGVGGFEREVALKVMHAHLREEEHFATDLIEEAKLAVRIQHGNVVQVLDVGEDPHGVFLVMEYIEGESLAGLQRACRKRSTPMPAPIGIRILSDALLGLHAAHELTDEAGEPLGLVHRDFSPQNILVGLDGVAKLTDFGVAKARTRLSHTATGLVKGKIHYMSPEQARTETIDRRCDIWAGGVMVWETLAGRRLYKERSDASILLKLITEPPPRLRTVRRDVPQALEDVVHHALATDVESRCPSAKLFADRLLAAADAFGGAASADEVAAYVKEMSGPTLRKRREQVGEVVKLRKGIKDIAAESTIDAYDLTTSPADGSRVAQVLAEDQQTEQVKTTIDLAAPKEDEQTVVTHSSPAIVPLQPKRTARTIGLMAGAAVLLVVAYVFMRSPSTTPSETSAEPASATPEPPLTSPAPSTSPAIPTADPSATIGPSISVRANAPVAELTIGSRQVQMKSPSDAFDTVLEAAEREKQLTVVAKSVDGRTARTVLPRNASSLTIQFPSRTVSPRPVGPRINPRPRPPTAAPLATNPHQ